MKAKVKKRRRRLPVKIAALFDGGACVEIHLKSVVKRTARKFNLEDVEREELMSALRHEALMAALNWHRHKGASAATYLSRVIDNAAVAWRKRYFAEATAKPLEAPKAPTGYQNSADDTEFSLADRWVYDEEQLNAQDDVGYETPYRSIRGYRYELRLMDFRFWCETLPPELDRIVELHLDGGTHESVAEALGLPRASYYRAWRKLRHHAKWFFHDL